MEYIPTANYKFMDWFRNKYLKARVHFGKDIYYWHIRHTSDPEYRKISDIDFIRHVVEDHDSNPTDLIEKRHYNRAWSLYGTEMKFVIEELRKDEGTEWEDGEFTDGHPYAYGYKKRWFDKYPIVETKLMYHGISMSQHLDLIDIAERHLLKKRDEYCKKYNLDPETGQKLPIKKAKKTTSKAKVKN